MKDIQTIGSKYTAGVKAGADTWLKGVQAVKTSPTAAAAAAVDKYEAGTRKAVSDGTFVDGCNSVTLAGWQADCASKGKSAYANAATAASSRYMDYMQQAAPVIAANQASVQAMPKITEADSDARMLENVKLQRGLKGRFRRRR